MTAGDGPGPGSRAVLDALAGHLGVRVTGADLEAAAASLDRLLPALRRLREVRLEYLDHVEPGDAERWIENGGRTAGPDELGR